MKAIIIGAGRGSRLRPHTDAVPKCLVPIGGKPILDWILEALAAVGCDEIVFVGGYRMAHIQRHLPQATFIENAGWRDNNILLSLFHAEAHMGDGFLCAYSDTVITQALLDPLMAAEGDITMALDTAWNERHGARPSVYDAHVEGTWVDGARVSRIARVIPPGDALGEFTGVMRFTASGAARWRAAFAGARARHAGGPFHHAAVFEKAYLVDLVQEMIDAGEPVGYTTCHGGYLEIDTVEDYELANRDWIHSL